MNQTDTRYTQGRGSNPVSRKNLTGATVNAYVCERGAGIGWTALSGPMTFAAAYRHAEKLEAMNHTGQRIYAAQIGLPA